MKFGSTIVQKEEKRKKYDIYVEEYVLSYLRREADSLELSEIYFYGSRQDDGREIYVYGAGRDKGIEAFAQYEPLSELVCRLTQAGPVFMVREPNGECNVNSFQVFYENNEAMQSYLLEWTGSADQKKDVEKRTEKEAALPILVSPEEKPKKEVHGAISVQLCLILMVLTAIVVTSTDSLRALKLLRKSIRPVEIEQIGVALAVALQDEQAQAVEYKPFPPPLELKRELLCVIRKEAVQAGKLNPRQCRRAVLD